MKSTVETLSPTRVRLEIEVPFAELEPNVKKAYRAISAQVNVPGFRKGKVPAAVIDRRIGRSVVLREAVQEVVPEQYLAAVQAHEVKTIGRPEVNVPEDVVDGEPLRFTVEVDVRPEMTLPDFAGIEIEVENVEVSEDEVDEQLDKLRQRFATLKTVERAAANGDFVQVDLAATVDGEEVAGGSASNVSHEVGSGQLVPGLDEALVGMSAGESATFTSQLVGGDYAGKDAEIAVTVRTVKEKQMPELDDAFAQLASEFDTLEEVRADLRSRLDRTARLKQLFDARDKAVQALIDATGVPAPDSVVRDEVEHRKESMAEQLAQMGGTLEAYLAAESKTEAELDAELTDAASNAVQLQLVMDAVADAEQVQVTDDEFGQEIVRRAQRSGLAPERYYDQLVRSGTAAAVFGDVRRGKALSLVLERVQLKDADGNQLSIDELRSAASAVDGAGDESIEDSVESGDES